MDNELCKKEIIRLTEGIDNDRILRKIYTVVLTFVKLIGGTE